MLTGCYPRESLYFLPEIDTLKTLITNHKDFTGSDVATSILNNWDNALQNFVKVMPVDYKLVLQNRKLEPKNLGNKEVLIHG